MENTPNQKFRALTCTLVLSGVLNLLLIVHLLFGSTCSLPFSLSSCPKEGAPINQAITSMAKLPFSELVGLLAQKEKVDGGYTKRDLALTTLVAFHHFNLEKALSGIPIPKKVLPLSKTAQVELFPGLKDEQFEEVLRFAYQEKWPLSAKGLFLRMKSAPDESLDKAFVLTPEFASVQLFFQKSGAEQETATLLQLVREGNWDLLKEFSLPLVEVSPEKRRALLLHYVEGRSKTAADILLKTDFSFALNQLNEEEILHLLFLLNAKSEKAVAFCVEILSSRRSDPVLHMAASRLYAYAGDTPSLPIDPQDALARYSSVKKEATPRTPSACATHIVKDGESLWKIARLYKVKVDEIVKLNELERDALYPGMTLMIPAKN